MRRTLSLLVRNNCKRNFSNNPKDFYDRFKNLKEKEEIRLKNRRMESTIDYLENEFDFKKEFEKELKEGIKHKIIDSFSADALEANHLKKKEMIDYIEDQKKSRITTDQIFKSENKVMDLDKANMILDSHYHRVRN